MVKKVKRYCPLTSNFSLCNRRCAWYNKDNKVCVIVNISLYIRGIYENGVKE